MNVRLHNHILPQVECGYVIKRVTFVSNSYIMLDINIDLFKYVFM